MPHEPMTKTETRLHFLFDKAKRDRLRWEANWDEIIEYVIPLNTSTSWGNKPSDTGGDSHPRRVFNNKQQDSNEEMANIIHGLMINPATAWASNVAIDDSLNGNQEVKQWLDDSSQAVLDAFASPRYGFPAASHELLVNEGAIGSSLMLCVEGAGTVRDPLIKFSTVPTSNLYFFKDGETTSSVVAGIGILQKMSARAIMDKFGNRGITGHIPTQARQVADGSDADEEQFDIVQIIEPRIDGEEQGKINTNKPFSSFFIDVDTGKIIDSGGFEEQPYAAARWSVIAGQVYGRSPSWRAMPNIKSLQQFTKTDLVAKQMSAFPPVIVPASLVEGPIGVGPASIIYTRGSTNAGIRPLFSGTNVQSADNAVDRLELAIDRSYYLDVLRLPEFDRATTLEVQSVQQQKMQTMSPILSRLFSEFVTPMWARTLSILMRKEIIGPMPEALAESSGIKVEMKGQLALSQRASKAASLVQFIGMISPIVDRDPKALAVIDSISYIHKIGQLLDIPAEVLNDLDASRAQVQQQEQQEQQQVQQESIAGSLADAGSGAKSFADAQNILGGG